MGRCALGEHLAGCDWTDHLALAWGRKQIQRRRAPQQHRTGMAAGAGGPCGVPLAEGNQLARFFAAGMGVLGLKSQ